MNVVEALDSEDQRSSVWSWRAESESRELLHEFTTNNQEEHRARYEECRALLGDPSSHTCRVFVVSQGPHFADILVAE